MARAVHGRCERRTIDAVDASDAALEARYRARSLWLDTLPGPLVPRPSLPGDATCDVVVLGGGFTGLWTAYSLAVADPTLRVILLEAEICGYGASGRNAGFASAGIAGEARVYERTHGREGVARAERAFIDGIGHVGEVVRAEAIECGWEPGGSFRVARSAPQLRRVEAGLAGKRARGWTPADMRAVTPDEIRERVRIDGVLGGTYTPHCARIHPAALARGLADACARRGVVIHERTPARRLEPGRVVTDRGTVRADVVVRATESYTTRLPGERRAFLTLASHMIATEPLPEATWRELGWERCETVADQAHLFLYAQRTVDGRIAVGGRGAPYAFGGAIREADEQRPAIRAVLEASLRAWFPAARDAAITHHWGGTFAAPRDWSMGVGLDRATGVAWAGGYSGHGVIASSIAGRTVADLVTGRDSALVELPWVGHRSPRWEPEPLRSLAARTIPLVLGGADRHEDRTGRPARRLRLVERFLPGR